MPGCVELALPYPARESGAGLADISEVGAVKEMAGVHASFDIDRIHQRLKVAVVLARS